MGKIPPLDKVIHKIFIDLSRLSTFIVHYYQLDGTEYSIAWSLNLYNFTFFCIYNMYI